MQNPDITMLLTDPDVGGGQSFVIQRRTARRVKGRLQTASVELITAYGSVQPADQNVLEQLPEADRDNEVKVFRTRTPMQNGSSDDTSVVYSDELIYQGGHYKILKSKDWSQWGMYVAYATMTAPGSQNVPQEKNHGSEAQNDESGG